MTSRNLVISSREPRSLNDQFYSPVYEKYSFSRRHQYGKRNAWDRPAEPLS